jgi:hypothetical protein
VGCGLKLAEQARKAFRRHDLGPRSRFDAESIEKRRRFLD